MGSELAKPSRDDASFGGSSIDGNPGARLPLDDVGRIVKQLEESGVGEIRIRQADLEIVVKAKAESSAPREAPHLEARATLQSNTEPEPALPDLASAKDGLHAVRSPLVGRFYTSPAPGQTPFVKVGDRVSAGQVLCIVEAMKMMNEIVAESSGRVVEILGESGAGVEYDQPLFRIRLEP